MKRIKRASEIFRDVDPELKVIDGGTRRSRSSNSADWDKAGGAVCPSCGQEAVRFRPSDGNCLKCVRELEEKQEQDDKKRARQLKFIKQHNARIDRKRGAKK